MRPFAPISFLLVTTIPPPPLRCMAGKFSWVRKHTLLGQIYMPIVLGDAAPNVPSCVVSKFMYLHSTSLKLILNYKIQLLLLFSSAVNSPGYHILFLNPYLSIILVHLVLIQYILSVKQKNTVFQVIFIV